MLLRFFDYTKVKNFYPKNINSCPKNIQRIDIKNNARSEMRKYDHFLRIKLKPIPKPKTGNTINQSITVIAQSINK